MAGRYSLLGHMGRQLARMGFIRDFGRVVKSGAGVAEVSGVGGQAVRKCRA